MQCQNPSCGLGKSQCARGTDTPTPSVGRISIILYVKETDQRSDAFGGNWQLLPGDARPGGQSRA